MEKPAELEKQAACLLFRLGGISNCWLLPGPADEHVLFLVDVMNLACSLQVRNGLLVPSFHGLTLSCTVQAVSTGPPCQEMAQIHAATKSLASAWNSIDFCQVTIISNSAYKCPITEPKKWAWSPLLSNISCHTHDLLIRGRPLDLPLQPQNCPKG